MSYHAIKNSGQHQCDTRVTHDGKLECNEHSTDEGHSPETSGHMFKFFGTLNNVLNFNFLL